MEICLKIQNHMKINFKSGNLICQVLNKCRLAEIVREDQRLLDAPGKVKNTPLRLYLNVHV